MDMRGLLGIGDMVARTGVEETLRWMRRRM